jgi:hypothetical protein
VTAGKRHVAAEDESMRENNPVGWFALNALTTALLLLVLMFFDPLQVLASDKRGAMLLALGLLVVATLLGVLSFRSGPGRCAAVMGGILLVLVGFVLFFLTPSLTPSTGPGPPVVTPGAGGAK